MAGTSAERVKRAARDGIALGLAVGTSGLAFGAVAVASGLSVAQACVLSLVAYTGASQFALAAAVAGGGDLIAGTASAILLGSRNGLYGLRLTSLLGFRGPFRLLAALGITDESTAVALAQPAGGQPDRAAARAAARAGFLATFGSLYLTWNAGTLAGALGAGRLGSPGTFGLDVVGPAAFLALLWPRLRDGRTERTVALAGAVIALAATPFCPPGLPVVLAAAAALGAALLPAGAALSPAGAPGPPGPADAAGASGVARAAETHLAGDTARAADTAGSAGPAGPADAGGERPCR
jgi:predicted branched-subunit amino acid permease